MRGRDWNVREEELVSLAKFLGRKKRKGGKHQNYTLDGRPTTQIPSHPGAVPAPTVHAVLDMLEGDCDAYEKVIQRSAIGGNGHGQH